LIVEWVVVLRGGGGVPEWWWGEGQVDEGVGEIGVWGRVVSYWYSLGLWREWE
jgi:hypothetical protein